MRSKFRRAVLILAVIFTLAGIHLYINTQNIDLNYKVTDLKIKLNEIRSKNRNLGSRVAMKEDLSNIERIAREQLKMFYPKEVTYINPQRINNSLPKPKE